MNKNLKSWSSGTILWFTELQDIFNDFYEKTKIEKQYLPDTDLLMCPKGYVTVTTHHGDHKDISIVSAKEVFNPK